MKILNPRTGETEDIPNLVSLAEERAKRQIPKPVALLDKDWDEDANQYVTTVTVEEHFQRQRLLNRYLAEKAEQGDAGDDRG